MATTAAAQRSGPHRPRVGHPRGQRTSRAVRQLAEQQRAVVARKAAIYAGAPAVEGVPAVVNSDFLRFLSRM